MRFNEISPLHIAEAIDPAEGPSRYWFVLKKDGYARCVNENDDDLFTLQDEGWDIVWDSAKSVEQGLERARTQWGLKPWVEPEEPEGESAYWFVLGKNGLARCVNENDRLAITLQREGWKLIWDSARSVEQGLERAYEQHGLLPWDDMEPIPVSQPKVLYRSVSIAEMRDILKTGAVVGKASYFNEYESRKWVFFGDKISKNLIWQGEDHERGMLNALADHPTHKKFADLQAQINTIHREIADDVREYLDDWNKRNARHIAEIGKREFSDEQYQRVLSGNYEAVRSALNILPDPGRSIIVKSLRKLEKNRSTLTDKFREVRRKALSAHVSKITAGVYTSCIIETKPITGGLHYSNAHGVSHFGHGAEPDLDEYTFRPGKVTVADIARIHWVKDKVVVATSTVEAAPGILRKLSAAPKQAA